MVGRRLLAVAVATALIAGCKTSVETEVKMSDLMSGQTQTIPASLYVEVAACADHEDSRRPSSSLVKVQGLVPGIFEGSKYVECFRKRFDSYARFDIPLTLDRDKDGKAASESQINLVANDQALLGLSVPKPIKDKLDAASKDLGAPSLDMKVTVKVVNDTGKDVPFRVLSAYVDGQPYVYGELTAHSGGSFVLTLSDVSVSMALNQAVAPVMIP